MIHHRVLELVERPVLRHLREHPPPGMSSEEYGLHTPDGVIRIA
jgi:hypothetical protein